MIGKFLPTGLFLIQIIDWFLLMMDVIPKNENIFVNQPIMHYQQIVKLKYFNKILWEPLWIDNFVFFYFFIKQIFYIFFSKSGKVMCLSIILNLKNCKSKLLFLLDNFPTN